MLRNAYPDEMGDLNLLSNAYGDRIYYVRAVIRGENQTLNLEQNCTTNPDPLAITFKVRDSFLIPTKGTKGLGFSSCSHSLGIRSEMEQWRGWLWADSNQCLFHVKFPSRTSRWVHTYSDEAMIRAHRRTWMHKASDGRLWKEETDSVLPFALNLSKVPFLKLEPRIQWMKSFIGSWVRAFSERNYTM